MSLPLSRHFNAYLPQVTAPVRIASFNDAKIFARRWVIRDKDRSLKALLRAMDRANSADATEIAIRDFKRELQARGLLMQPEAASASS